MLRELATEKKFELFKAYLEDIKSSYESRTKRYVKEFCKKEDYVTLVRSIVHNIVLKISTTVKDLDIDMPIKLWLWKVHERLNNTLTINLGEVQDII